VFRFLSPTFRHALLVVLGGFAFALAGCLGSIAVFSYDSQSPYGFIGVAALIIGLLIMLVGGVLLVIAVFKKLLGR
jgi:hypothetical protein